VSLQRGEIELYLYWRVPSASLPAAVAALAAWQGSLCADTPGLQARWLRRADDAAGAGADPTVMEIYTRPGGIDPQTAARIERDGNAALSGWLSGPRHVERFVAG
jgi:hypothetical protein